MSATRVPQRRNVQTFVDFCSEHVWGATWSVLVDAVMHFAVHLYQSGLAVATIFNTLATVPFVAKAGGGRILAMILR